MAVQEYVIRLSGRTEREGEYWSAFCSELPVASAGRTQEEAIENVKNAIKGYIHALVGGGGVVK